jgi:hypothetical protein
MAAAMPALAAPVARSARAKLLEHPMAAHALVPVEELHPQRMALQKAKKWRQDMTVKVAFLERPRGNLKTIIGDAVAEWQSLMKDLKFRIVDFTASAEVLIGFQNDGHWSLVGTDSVANSMRQQFGGRTLNIQASVINDDRMARAVALHELGHALGCIHEHQSTEGTIPWNKNAVYQYYSSTQHWSRPQIDFQVLSKAAFGSLNATRLDPHSIMYYPLPADLLDHSQSGWEKYVSDWNLNLSEMDRQFIGEQYGKPLTPIQNGGGSNAGGSNAGGSSGGGSKPTIATVTRDLSVNQATEGELRDYGQVDYYRINVAAAGKYVVETTEYPATFVVVDLTRGDDTAIATGQLNGRRLLNARIEADLSAGSYGVRVRHRHRPGQGKYTIVFRNA